MYVLSFKFGVFGSLITPAFFYILSLSSPDHQVGMLCLEFCCFVCVIQPSQLSCLGGSVGVEHLPRTQNVAYSSPARFSLKNGEKLHCVVLYCFGSPLV